MLCQRCQANDMYRLVLLSIKQTITGTERLIRTNVDERVAAVPVCFLPFSQQVRFLFWHGKSTLFSFLKDGKNESDVRNMNPSVT